MRARVRRRALQALVESLCAGESKIPTMKWRRQYLKTPGIGPAAVSVIVNHIQGLPLVVSGPVTPAPQSLKKRPWHQIRTLDMRALHVGDDGFVEMMSALLEDTLIENVIFAGNNITDDGVRRLVSHIQSFNNTPTVDSGTSAAAEAGTAAGSVPQKRLPCKLKLLALTDNFITSEGIATFTTVAPLFLSLEQLEVGRGQSAGGGDVDDVRDTLSAQHITALSRYIQRTPKLVTFLYKGNGNYYARSGFTPDGMTAFVDAVVGDSALKELYLQECFSTKPGVVGPLTVQAPRGGKEAVRADLDDSWAPEKLLQPMQALATALNAATSNLSTLILRFPLSDEAVQTLSIGLAQTPHLLDLSLRGCDLSSKALGVIGDALCKNKVLRMLDVSYQSNTIAHPAFMAELRSSSKRRLSFISTVGYTAAEMARQDLSSSGAEVPSREERQHPLLPIIRSLHKNRSLSQLVMLGVNISTDDIEELCACIERSGNRTLVEVWYTRAGSDALDMKLEDFLASNRQRGAGASAAAGSGPFGCSLGSTYGGLALPVSRSSGTLFPDAALSDSTESPTKSTKEGNSAVRNRKMDIPHGLAPSLVPILHHTPHNGDRRAPPSSLESTQTVLKAVTVNTKMNTATFAAERASPSEVAVSLVCNGGDASVVRQSSTQRVNSEDKSCLSLHSGDIADDAGTVPYYSQMPSEGRKKQ
ncbi:conserved hypothetical protein [Leishmania mexicana MHOM/GT/2001/U1103]|uniref:Uncharacterized protein n=1 Tax=Leishmania mexicana (strain MHOM/GT/2001/U1103) TaxID=929439 RepID=E9B4V3_LEIMU|nr:conserved hypothetical protein [Leishmania mexicana MHOM/GT/2001/U1103]CBZ30272.1 conserved hypothetical protein [Leishmania mexicana MHOM/GT/2001/U1103]